MKKTILMLVIAAMSINLNAQDKKANVKGFGTATTEITWVNGKIGYNIGAYGGVLLNRKFCIGLAGNNIFFNQIINNKKENIQFNYYGLYSEFKIKQQKNVHLSFGLTGAIGWQENKINSIDGNSRKDGDFTIVLKPKVGLNIGIAKFMQIQTYASYRFTGNTNSLNYNPNNFNGFSGGIGLSFGSF